MAPSIVIRRLALQVGIVVCVAAATAERTCGQDVNEAHAAVKSVEDRIRELSELKDSLEDRLRYVLGEHDRLQARMDRLQADFEDFRKDFEEKAAAAERAQTAATVARGPTQASRQHEAERLSKIARAAKDSLDAAYTRHEQLRLLWLSLRSEQARVISERNRAEEELRQADSTLSVRKAALTAAEQAARATQPPPVEIRQAAQLQPKPQQTPAPAAGSPVPEAPKPKKDTPTEPPPRVEARSSEPEVSPTPTASPGDIRPEPKRSRLPLLAGAGAGAGLLVLLGAVLFARRRRPAPPLHAANVLRVGNAVITLGNAQHIGKRPEQQDAFGFSDPDDAGLVQSLGVIAVVADGMGGMAMGSQASNVAVRRFLQVLARSGHEPVTAAMRTAIEEANGAVTLIAAHAGLSNEIGTTLAAVSVNAAGLQWIAAGDSRIYLYRDGQLTQLTTDHNYARLLDSQVRDGQLPADVAATHPKRYALTSFLGAPQIPEIDESRSPVPLQDGDRVILCTDGLYNAVEPSTMAQIIGASPNGCGEALVAHAVAQGRPQQDNITVVEIAVEDPPSRRRKSGTQSRPVQLATR